MIRQLRQIKYLNNFAKNIDNFNTNLLKFKWVLNDVNTNDKFIPNKPSIENNYEISPFKLINSFDNLRVEIWTTGYSVELPVGYYGLIIPKDAETYKCGLFNIVTEDSQSEIMIFINKECENKYQPYYFKLLSLLVKNN
jgi:hypothetical protein